MQLFWEFISLTNPNVRYVLLGTLLFTSGTALVGVFAFLRRRALTGDAVAHAILPGICIAFIVSSTKNPYYFLIGSFITGWLSLQSIDWIKKYSKLKEDTAIAIVLTVFFGAGIVLLTMIQHSGNASQSGLDQYILGRAASIVWDDILVFGFVSLFLFIMIGLFFKEFTLLSFDRNFAISIGWKVHLLDWLLSSLTVLAIITGIQAVGVVLMAAMLITPAAAARYWTDKLLIMILLALSFAVLSGFAGAYVSFVFPGMPTGPWMVLVISCIAFVSFLFSPHRGYLIRYFIKWKEKRRMEDENILKAMYHCGEKNKNFQRSISLQEIMEKRSYSVSKTISILNRLIKKGYVERNDTNFVFTEMGKVKGQRVTKLHRLWEMYLSKYLSLDKDHVHEDAESMEHIITPEIEAKLEELLEYPTHDPHDSEIPYRK